MRYFPVGATHERPGQTVFVRKCTPHSPVVQCSVVHTLQPLGRRSPRLFLISLPSHPPTERIGSALSHAHSKRSPYDGSSKVTNYLSGTTYLHTENSAAHLRKCGVHTPIPTKRYLPLS